MKPTQSLASKLVYGVAQSGFMVGIATTVGFLTELLKTELLKASLGLTFILRLPDLSFPTAGIHLRLRTGDTAELKQLQKEELVGSPQKGFPACYVLPSANCH
jgi:hypothetical protein